MSTERNGIYRSGILRLFEWLKKDKRVLSDTNEPNALFLARVLFIDKYSYLGIVKIFNDTADGTEVRNKTKRV
jgi:hypothetical protein